MILTFMFFKKVVEEKTKFKEEIFFIGFSDKSQSIWIGENLSKHFRVSLA